ncbi:uncharacterized protein [Haliotis cracherodii]|uniref:uncharacterized protein isoform X2 n=1 Tax=Haliotis cracherodii TaxID=6455 RepID=UPI0039ED9B96
MESQIPQLATMTWPEFIKHMLATTHKIQKAAVLAEDGQPLAVTEDLQVSVEEGQALIRSILDPARSVTRIHMDNNFYTCFQGNSKTLVGTSPNRDRIFVAHKSKDCVVVVFGGTKGHGSYLFELKKNLSAREHREDHMKHLHNQEQITNIPSQEHITNIPRQEQITNIPSQGQIQQILNAAEDERLASEEADDMEQLSEMGQESMEIDDFPHGQDTLGGGYI